MFLKRLDEGAKSGATLVAVSYAVGVVVSNAYLASMGILDFDLLRPKAILSGVWFLWFLAVAMVAEDSIQRALRLKEIPASWRFANAAFAAGGAFIFYFVVLLTIAALSQQHASARNPWAILKDASIASLVMFLAVGTMFTEGQNAAKEWRRRTTDQRVGPTSAAFFVFHCTWSLAAVFVFGSLFITHVYSNVPQQYGGGKPRAVRIAVTEEAARALGKMSITTTNNVIVGSTVIVHETPSTIAFRVDSSNTMILQRSEISAMGIE